MEVDNRKNETRTELKEQDIMIEVSGSTSEVWIHALTQDIPERRQQVYSNSK
jgi:uncharacterized protein with NAD-binding domain and iron-sulfur cluster